MSRRFVIDKTKAFFIYDSSGEWLATKIGNYVFDGSGDYVGFVVTERYDVYTQYGEWIGNLQPDGRIVRKRSMPRPPLVNPKMLPPRPPKPKLPERAPVPPLNIEIGYDKIDVLEWDPDVFKRVSDLTPDAGEENA